MISQVIPSIISIEYQGLVIISYTRNKPGILIFKVAINQSMGVGTHIFKDPGYAFICCFHIARWPIKCSVSINNRIGNYRYTTNANGVRMGYVSWIPGYAAIDSLIQNIGIGNENQKKYPGCQPNLSANQQTQQSDSM